MSQLGSGVGIVGARSLPQALARPFIGVVGWLFFFVVVVEGNLLQREDEALFIDVRILDLSKDILFYFSR